MARTSSSSDANEPEEGGPETEGGMWGRRSGRELITMGMEPATAIGILSIESAFSLSMAMMNAVNEQKNQWTADRCVTIAAIDRLFRNDVLDDAVESLLGGEPRRAKPAG
jgi:hypothetical protein